MAEKITHPILEGLLHPEWGEQGKEFSELHTLLPPASQATSAVDVSGCGSNCDTIRVTVTAAPAGRTLHLHSHKNSVSETPEQQRLL